MSLKRVGVTLVLAVAACGGQVSRGDSVVSSVPVGADPPTETGTTTNAAPNATTNAAASPTTSAPVPGTSVAVSTVWVTRSTTAFYASGSASSGVSYSQNANAPLDDDAGSFPWITCYGRVDGTMCQVSDINGGSSLGNGVHSVDCSTDAGTCHCLLSNGNWPNGTTTGTFPFSPGACPTGSSASPYPNSGLGSVQGSACASSAAVLFARCGW